VNAPSSQVLTVGTRGLPGRAHALEAVVGVQTNRTGGAGTGRAVVVTADRRQVGTVAVAGRADAQILILVGQTTVVEQLVDPVVGQAVSPYDLGWR
jgi:hypothetical protein